LKQRLQLPDREILNAHLAGGGEIFEIVRQFVRNLNRPLVPWFTIATELYSALRRPGEGNLTVLPPEVKRRAIKQFCSDQDVEQRDVRIHH
jgi:hypothetical protein